MDRTGKCLCGAVTFTAKGTKPDQASACHCGMCQRWTGGPLLSVFVEELKFEREEGLTWYQSSEFAQRAFCNRCGSSLFWRLTAEGKYQGTTSVGLGVLDDSSGAELVKEWFIDRKPDCYALAGDRDRITEAEAMAMLANS